MRTDGKILCNYLCRLWKVSKALKEKESEPEDGKRNLKIRFEDVPNSMNIAERWKERSLG